MHQIGNTFTRLQSAIEFTESDLQESENTVCVLGEPPARFTAVHSQALLNAWYKRIQRCLTEPVQIELRKGHRRVQVLGTAIFDFGADGLLEVYVWDFDENDRIMLDRLPGHTVVIDGVPFKALWMERYKLGAARALQQRHPGQEALIRSYMSWAQTELASQSWDERTQDAVRYRIAVELDLDADLLLVAQQIQLSSLPERPMRVDVYNRAVTYRKEFQTLSLEAPKLIPLYGLLAEGLAFYDSDSQWEVTARMQGFLVHAGIKPAFWRLLCREGTQWMNEFLAYYDVKRFCHSVTAVDLLRLAQAFGTERLVPSWLLRAFMQLGGNPNSPTTDIADRLGEMFEFCARLGHLVTQVDEASMPVFKDRAQDICAWASDHWNEIPKGYIRRATLRGLIRKADAQQRLDAMRLQGSERWEIPYQVTLKSSEVQAVVLDSPLAVWTEGRDMRHCADKYIEPCTSGECVMVSLRSAGRRHALATIAFDMRPSEVVQRRISGFANTLVSAEVLQLAQECRRQLQSQRKRMQRRHASA